MRHWHAITDYPKITKETPAASEALIETIEQHLHALENSGKSLIDIALVGLFISKLISDTVNQWADNTTLPDNKMSSYMHLLAFLEKRASCGKMAPTTTPSKRLNHVIVCDKTRHGVTHAHQHILQ
jgi:hypothetical protein